MVRRFREWRVDRLIDRIARRPHGRRARKTYGADDAHSLLWEPVLAALELEPDDRLLDVGCGGGVFLRRALESGCSGAGLDHSRDMVRVARKTVGEPRASSRARLRPCPSRTPPPPRSRASSHSSSSPTQPPCYARCGACSILSADESRS